nr:mannitol dehydrogenase family protein [Gordonia sp. LAM0048]
MTRLSLDHHGELPAPIPDPRAVTVGQVHLGLGAFHRAHQAVYAADAMARSGENHWGIAAFTQRSGTAAHRLAPQGGVYTVVEKGPDAQPARLIGSVRETLDGSGDADVIARLCDPAVRVVTLTVTEKGYRHDPVTRQLALDSPDVAADLAGRAPRTVPAILATALARRSALGDAPLTVISCDNLPENGRLLHRLVAQYADAAGLPFDDAHRFPSTVVDRIVPATTDADIAALERAHGVHDAAPVLCEPFRQWVIENDFAGPVPAWSAAGASYVDDATPWELLKLRVLNASHSILAYVGLRCGHRRISDAVVDPTLERICRRFIDEDVAPVVDAPAGVTVSEYGDQVLRRFANRALPHTTLQVAADGSQKIGPRLLDTVRDAAARGRSAHWAVLGVAAWALHVVDPIDAGGKPTVLDDPRAGDLVARVAGLAGPQAVRRLLADTRFVGDLADDTDFVDTAVAYATALHRGGIAALASEVSL